MSRRLQVFFSVMFTVIGIASILVELTATSRTVHLVAVAVLAAALVGLIVGYLRLRRAQNQH